MSRRILSLGAAFLAVALGMPPATHAQVTESNLPSTFGDRKLEIPSTATLVEKGPKFAVETAAEVSGLVRGGKKNRSTNSFNTLEFTATGTMAEPGADGAWKSYRVSKVIAASDFVIPASRFEVHLVDAAGHAKHEIRVVAGQKAWNEEKPGINGTAMPDALAADRVRQIWLTPQGALWGALRAVDANDNVTVNSEAGRLVIRYPWRGDQIKINFDAGLEPTRVEIKAHSAGYGDTTFTATYLGYKDFMGYLAPFPTKMTYKAGARVILDLTVTDCQVNPYVMFPTPDNMVQSTTQQH